MRRRLALHLIPLTIAAATAALTGCASAPGGSGRTVYHINTGVDTAAAALNNVRNHLNADPQARIVVVTHGPGIDFLLQGARDNRGREFSASVSELAARKVAFRVCNNTLATRRIDPNQLLMETTIVPSGVAEVARLQSQEGFAYVKP